MEVFKSETREILRRLQKGRLSLEDCIASLDEALAGVIPYVTSDQMDELRGILMANNDAVLREVARRGEMRRGRAASVSGV